jgi:tyrosine-protein phosphatase YwqE
MFQRLLRFFKEEEVPPLQSYELLGADMHSHLIPGIDDGVKTTEEAVECVKRYMALGYKKIITTPHIVPGGYNNSPSTILPGRDKVREALQKEGINIPFEAAAEYYVDELLSDKIKNKELLTFGDNHVLIEYSYYAKPRNAAEIIFELKSKGYKVILAHPERYPFYYDDKCEQYEEIRDRGVYLQLNMASLLGKYGKGAQIMGMKLVEKGLVDFVGSDLHNDKLFPALELLLKNKHLVNLIRSGKLKNHLL